MTLSELAGTGSPDVRVCGISYSSARTKPGDLFFCVRGFNSDGHDFAKEAVSRGAVALVCERSLNLGVSEVVVDDVRRVLGPLSARFYGDPSTELAVIAITGTNGKTTTAFLLRELLERAGLRTGLLGSVGTVIGGVPEPSARTTPEAPDLQNRLWRMRRAGDQACVMEASSHALALGRTAGTHFHTRVFTNLTRDHLDFHMTMENYFRAKRRLFEGPGAIVVCTDTEYGQRLAGEFTPTATFALDNDADFRARNINSAIGSSGFVLETARGGVDVKMPLSGRFNVQNALGAAAAGATVGITDPQALADGLGSAPRVPGRFELIDEGQEFTAVVDFAHTPDALANCLAAARDLTRGSVHVVFGAEGDSDRGKRALMGAAARRFADHIILTSDDPRSEDPRKIIEEVADGYDLPREVDRWRAIERAVIAARPGDTVVVAGRGSEQYQIFAAGRREPFNDTGVVREMLRSRSLSQGNQPRQASQARA